LIHAEFFIDLRGAVGDDRRLHIPARARPVAGRRLDRRGNLDPPFSSFPSIAWGDE
jgi:hypothetical protein